MIKIKSICAAAAVGVSLFILAIAIAFASLKLYDIPVRKRLSNKR